MKKYLVILLIAFLGLSCGKKDDNEIKIGALFPLTGDVASYGINAKNGIELKIDEVNSTGGISGKKIVIDFQDDKNSIKDAVNIFTDFVSIKKYPIVLGSAGSSVSLALVPIAKSNKVLLMSPVSSSAKLSTEGGEYFFRTVPSDNLQAEMLTNWVIKEGIKKVAVIYTNNSWGKPLSDAFIELFTKNGGEVVFSEGFRENTNDYRTLILKMKKFDFEAIITPTYPKEGGQFVKQLKEAGISTKLFGGDNWGAPEFLSIAKNAAEGACFTFPSDSKSDLFNRFSMNYERKYKVKPDIISAYGYDAAAAVVKAIESSKTLQSDDIRKALLTISFEGVSGKIAFKPNGDLISSGYGKRKIINGKSISLN